MYSRDGASRIMHSAPNLRNVRIGVGFDQSGVVRDLEGNFELFWVGPRGVKHPIHTDAVPMHDARYYMRGLVSSALSTFSYTPEGVPALNQMCQFLSEGATYHALRELNRFAAEGLFTCLARYFHERRSMTAPERNLSVCISLRDFGVTGINRLAEIPTTHPHPQPLVTIRTNREAWMATTWKRQLLKRAGREIRDFIVGGPDMCDEYDLRDTLQDLVNIGVRFDPLPDAITDHYVHAMCGHVEVRDDAPEDSDGNRICCECDDGMVFVIPEDGSTWHRRRELYEVDGDFYIYDPYESDDDDESSEGIFDWSTLSVNHLNAPEVVSTPTGEFTIGMEFECDPRGYSERRELAEFVNDELRGKAMCKRDGSLNDTGLEIVFAPMTLESTKKAWRQVEFPSTTRAWNAGNCGTHVHIDARAFTKLTLAKFVQFWNEPGNAELITRVAGRHPLTNNQAQQYAATVETDTTSVMRTMKVPGINDNRYRCVNLTTLDRQHSRRLGLDYQGGHHSEYNTVELRIFRASLKAERTLAQVEMAHASVVFSRDGSCADMSADAFTKWLVKNGRRYPHLKAWLGLTKPLKLRSATAETETA